MPNNTAVRRYRKHDPVKIAKRVHKAGGTIEATKIGGFAEVRAGRREKVIKRTNKVARTGKKGRPSIFYTLTPKGRRLAEGS